MIIGYPRSALRNSVSSGILSKLSVISKTLSSPCLCLCSLRLLEIWISLKLRFFILLTSVYPLWILSLVVRLSIVGNIVIWSDFCLCSMCISDKIHLASSVICCIGFTWHTLIGSVLRNPKILILDWVMRNQTVLEDFVWENLSYREDICDGFGILIRLRATLRLQFRGRNFLFSRGEL